MKFLDLFAGIGGFRLGMEAAGHECVGFCEIDPFARKSYKAIHNRRSQMSLNKTRKRAIARAKYKQFFLLSPRRHAIVYASSAIYRRK